MQTMTRPSVKQAMQAHNKGTVIGEGSSRRVFWKKGSFWAYKFLYNLSWSRTANKDEYANYLELKDRMPEGIKLPTMELLDNGILATEYIEGTQSEFDCYADSHECDDEKNCWLTRLINSGMDFSLTGFKDISWANVILADSGDIYLIDLEF
jgi:hypothetical protein